MIIIKCKKLLLQVQYCVMSSRSFLFLQGVASPFFSELGRALINEGHKVSRINFCGGDYFFSKAFDSNKVYSTNYNNPLDALPKFIERLLNEKQISDIILFGDTRPIHKASIDLAKQNNINIHVFEEGYLRPSWITLDKEGVNANSKLSKDPQWYRDFVRTSLSKETIETHKPKDTGKQMRPRAWHDMRYHFAGLLLKPLFPTYRTHRPETPLTEYVGWIKRFPRISLFHKKQAEETIQMLVSEKRDFYVLPLQLNADAQMREHSPIKTVLEVIEITLRSFAKYAPTNSLLIIKNHPLDTGLINYLSKIKQATLENGIKPNRVIYLETGDLNTLLEYAKGTVLVNSTVGMSALAANCPTITLGSAIYDIPGLTYQGKLDDFWVDALKLDNKPDDGLFNDFKKSLIALNQINGDFYTRKGIKMAVLGSLPFLDPDNHQSSKSNT